MTHPRNKYNPFKESLLLGDYGTVDLLDLAIHTIYRLKRDGLVAFCKLIAAQFFPALFLLIFTCLMPTLISEIIIDSLVLINLGIVILLGITAYRRLKLEDSVIHVYAGSFLFGIVTFAHIIRQQSTLGPVLIGLLGLSFFMFSSVYAFTHLMSVNFNPRSV